MTAPRRGGDQATMRGAIVLVVALIVGIALLSKSGDLVGSAEAGSAKPTTTTATTATTVPLDTVVPPATDAPASQTTHPAAEVTVIVINASGQKGVAGTNDEKVKSAGFKTLEFKNGPAADTTTIFYKDGFQADAEAVKTATGLTTATITAAPADPIIPEAADADVVVVIGKDYQG